MKLSEKAKIIEWLYLNEKGFNSSKDWRKGLINMLEDLVEKPSSEYDD